MPQVSSSPASGPRCAATSSFTPGSSATQRNPANSAAGSSVRPSDLTVTSGNPSRPGSATKCPALSYVQPGYGQVNRFALPQPDATCACRCRHTFSNALTCPSDVLVSRTDRPITVLVQYA